MEQNGLSPHVPHFKDVYRKSYPVLPAFYLPGLQLPNLPERLENVPLQPSTLLPPTKSEFNLKEEGKIDIEQVLLGLSYIWR